MAQVNLDVKSVTDTAFKVVVTLAGFMAADAFLFSGAITPDPIKPLIGWIVCAGAGIVALKQVK